MYNSSGTYVRLYGSPTGLAGSGIGQFNGPNGLTIDDSDFIYVTDSLNHRIVKFKDANNDGTLTSNEWQVFGGTKGTGVLQFNSPKGAFYKNGKLFVADTFNSRVVIFNPSNAAATWTTFGSAGSGNGKFKAPMDINVDVTNNIWVSDTSNNRVQRFDPNGVWIINYSSSLPYGISSDINGNVYVAERMTGLIKNVNDSFAYGGTGTTVGKFTSPVGVDVDRDGRLWITDVTSNKVQNSINLLQ